MNHQLLPPPEASPPRYAHLSITERIALWAEHVDTCLEIVMARLREKTNSEQEFREALQEWLELRRADHDQAMANMMRKFREHEMKNDK
jgi:hypothetical protein